MILSEGRLAGDQIIGDRKRQEDDFGIVDLSKDGKDFFLLVLADGMGGHVGGAEAAEAAVESFVSYVESVEGPTSTLLSPALAKANTAIARTVESKSEWKGMGCTLTGIIIDDEGLWWISVGDSPLYLIRDNNLNRMNDDHSMRSVLDDMVKADRTTAADAAANPNRNALRSAVSGRPIKLVDAPLEPVPLLAGDIIILASDGLDSLSESELLAVLKKNRRTDASGIVSALLKAVVSAEKPEQDNTTVISYIVDKPTSSVNESSNTSSYKDFLSNLKNLRFSSLFLIIVIALVITVGVLGGMKRVSPPEDTRDKNIIKVNEILHENSNFNHGQA